MSDEDDSENEGRKREDPMPEHKKFREIKNKYDKHFSEEPGK